MRHSFIHAALWRGNRRGRIAAEFCALIEAAGRSSVDRRGISRLYHERPTVVAKSVITNSPILRDFVQNLSGENRVEIAQDFGRTEILRTSVGTGYDLAYCIDQNQTGDSVAGVFPNCVFASKF